jgi:hypothetical protein
MTAVRKPEMVYAINCDLRRPFQDYEGLYAEIKNCGNWWHFLDSLRLVDTTLKADGIWTRLQRLGHVRFQTVHHMAHQSWGSLARVLPAFAIGITTSR